MFRHADVVCDVAGVHHVAVLNAAFGMTLQFVNARRGCKRGTIWNRHTPEPVS